MPSTRSTDNLLECGANKGISYICYEADLQYKNLKKLTKKRLIWDHVLHPYPPNKKIKIADTNIPEPAVHLPPHPTVAPTNTPKPVVHLPPRVKMLICQHKECIKSSRADIAGRRELITKYSIYLKREKANLAQLRKNVTIYLKRIRALKEEIV